jgi:hypothetical protein
VLAIAAWQPPPVEIVEMRDLAYSWLSRLALKLDPVDFVALKCRYIRAAGYTAIGDEAHFNARRVHDALERDHGDGQYRDRVLEASQIVRAVPAAKHAAVKRTLVRAKRQHFDQAQRTRLRARESASSIAPETVAKRELAHVVRHCEPISAALIADRISELRALIGAALPRRSERPGRPSAGAFVEIAERELTDSMSREDARSLLRAVAILPTDSAEIA